MVRENVKAVLSENKELISISFAAVIQTLKADPELTELIYNIAPIANDSRYHDNYDNNNAIKYLESNKYRIMDLVEKNYENLVEALTNNAINTTAASSTPTL